MCRTALTALWRVPALMRFLGPGGLDFVAARFHWASDAGAFLGWGPLASHASDPIFVPVAVRYLTTSACPSTARRRAGRCAPPLASTPVTPMSHSPTHY